MFTLSIVLEERRDDGELVEYHKHEVIDPGTLRLVRDVLEAEWSLRLFDRNGKQLWQKPVPGVALAVSIAGDGRLAIAAFGDGIIRWFQLEDGAELLAFFPHADRERWVVWTLKATTWPRPAARR